MVSAGRILILPQGTWDNATMYNMLDLVAYNGISWLCKRQCVGITPSATATEYWQQFGSSAPIASTTVAGLVMPDGQTITINTTTGAIAVPTATAAALGLVKVDGTSITIDANGVISSAGGNLSNLGDVAITSLANGQVLIWNQTNQKWQNGTIAGALSALSDVTITSATDGQILVYDATEQKWKNATAQATLSNSTKPIQTKVVKDMASDVIETLSAEASQAYSAGDLIMCSNGKWYKAITDISQNQTLTAGGNVEETSQRALNTNLTQSLNGFEFREDSQSGKGQYSMDGGSTWQNFSSGSEDDWTNYSTTDSAYFTTTTASKTFHLGKGTCVFVTAKRYGGVHHVTIEYTGKTQALTLQGADNQVVNYGVFIVNEEQDVIVRQTDSSVYGDATVYLAICNPPTT